MDENVKSQWVAALRSGEYKQGKGRLRKTDDSTGETLHCCLGVLCEISGLAEWVPNETDAYLAPGYGDKYENGVLPAQVKLWAGLVDDNPKVVGKPLAMYNDEGATFEEIAGLIEANL